MKIIPSAFMSLNFNALIHHPSPLLHHAWYLNALGCTVHAAREGELHTDATAAQS